MQIEIHTHINMSVIPKRAVFSSLLHRLLDEYIYVYSTVYIHHIYIYRGARTLAAEMDFCRFVICSIL